MVVYGGCNVSVSTSQNGLQVYFYIGLCSEVHSITRTYLLFNDRAYTQIQHTHLNKDTHLFEKAVAHLQVLVEPVDAHRHLAVRIRDLDVALLLQQAHL